MTWPPSPAWLDELQARFGDMLRTPLERSNGSLQANPAAYSNALLRDAHPGRDLSSGERLATYNRQYWFRLFTVLQRAYPLTARLVGYWGFNELAANFLLARAPQGWNLNDVGRGFADFLADALPGDVTERSATGSERPRAALLEAARIDHAYHEVFRAPAVTRYEPSPGDAGRLERARLRLSPAVALLTEHWPLCALRQRALEAAALDRLDARPGPARHWLLARDGLTLGLVPLAPRELQLLTLLSRGTVTEALSELEQVCRDSGSASELQDLPANTQQWLARSVRLGVWVGADFPA